MGIRQLIEAVQSTVEPVDVAGFPTVYVRTLESGEALEFIDNTDRPGGEQLIRLALKALCEEDGTRIYSDDEEDAVRRLPLPLIIAAGNVAQRINTFDEGDDDAGKSGGAPDGSLPSA